MNHEASWVRNCPLSLTADSPRISLDHGEGARLSRQLLTETILPRFSQGGQIAYSDAGLVTTVGCRLAVCADSHTVSPLFFPGGDIGSMAVYGTVNDLAVSGAHPRWLTLSLIIEEGLPLVVLEKILDSVARAARHCRVSIISGDTKVVPRGAVDSLIINTGGIGELVDPVPPGPRKITVGDRILVSGPIGSHGIAVLSAREGMSFEESPKSDSRSLIDAVIALRDSVGEHVRSVRDATRGGVSAVLREWAQECGHTFALKESWIPISEPVRGACELLGLDPLYIANEGTFVAVIDSRYADAALFVLRKIPGCEDAAIIGDVQPSGICPVTIQRTFAAPQPLDEPSGAPLPRIC